MEVNGIKLKVCKLCDECGFLPDSQIGVLKPELGLLEIIATQTLFPCHKVLKAHSGSENHGTKEYVAETGEIKVCYGYIASLKKSNIAPKNKAIQYLYGLIDDNSEDYKQVMRIPETLKYHGVV